MVGQNRASIIAQIGASTIPELHKPNVIDFGDIFDTAMKQYYSAKQNTRDSEMHKKQLEQMEREGQKSALAIMNTQNQNKYLDNLRGTIAGLDLSPDEKAYAQAFPQEYMKNRIQNSALATLWDKRLSKDGRTNNQKEIEYLVSQGIPFQQALNLLYKNDRDNRTDKQKNIEYLVSQGYKPKEAVDFEYNRQNKDLTTNEQKNIQSLIDQGMPFEQAVNTVYKRALKDDTDKQKNVDYLVNKLKYPEQEAVAIVFGGGTESVGKELASGVNGASKKYQQNYDSTKGQLEAKEDFRNKKQIEKTQEILNLIPQLKKDISEGSGFGPIGAYSTVLGFDRANKNAARIDDFNNRLYLLERGKLAAEGTTGKELDTKAEARRALIEIKRNEQEPYLLQRLEDLEKRYTQDIQKLMEQENKKAQLNNSDLINKYGLEK